MDMSMDMSSSTMAMHMSSSMTSMMAMSMPSSTMSMGMSTATSAAMPMSSSGSVNITYLPLSDPRCRNSSCLAYAAGHNQSQTEISWASQFEYGKWTTYYYCIFLFLFGLWFYSQKLGSGYVLYPEPKTTIVQKFTALVRSLTYRRIGIGMSLGVAAFILLASLFATIMTFAQRPYYRMFRGFGSPPLGVRTGLMAVALTPIIVALSGKYNIVTLMTGISHEKLNVLHRYVSYICLALSIVHTVPFIVQPLKEGGAAALRKQFYSPGADEYTGVPPFAMLVFLCTFSIPWFRHRFYEIFVHSHIGAAIVYLGLMFWHAGMALDSWDYLWATLAVWLFSLCGRLLVKLKTPGFKGAEATLEDIDGEILKITIPAFEAFAKWKPGQHVFLRFPTISPVDNHPFTIASACDETYVTDRKGRTTRKPILFLIKPQKGITKRLMKIAQQDASPRTRPVLIEGPYGGHHCQFEYRYEQMILVAGGSGITAVLPLLTDLSRKIGRERTVIRQIKLIWAVKHKHALAWVRDQLHEALTTAPAGTVTIDYYVTSENSTSESSSTHTPDAEKAVPQLPDDGKQVEVHEKNDVLGPGLFGRPVLRQLIPAALEHERICVVGCGPKGMNQDLSNAVATCQTKVLRGEVQEVALHTETFGW